MIDDNLTTETVKGIVKNFSKGKDWMHLCNLKKQEIQKEDLKQNMGENIGNIRENTYYSKDYLPMKEREIDKAEKECMRDIKAYSKNIRGWGSRKKREVYNEKRLQEYYDVIWDFQIDLFTEGFISYSSLDDGQSKGHVTWNLTYDDDGNLTDYDIGDVERGWNRTKEGAYGSYLKTHPNDIRPKREILNEIHADIKKRVPLILNMFRLKPRTRNIPAKVRYEVFKRDDGRCVFCGSNVNIEFDHIIPFSKGGSHNADNIRVLCQECNRKRGDNIEKF